MKSTLSQFREALAVYGNHRSWCVRWEMPGVGCSCGWDETSLALLHESYGPDEQPLRPPAASRKGEKAKGSP